MFTKEDFLQFFGDIQEIENEMEATYTSLAKNISHQEYQTILTKMAADEHQHSAMIKGLMDLFQ